MWFGKWFGNWFGRWFGSVPSAETYPYTRYGRILNPNKDVLFSYPPPGLCAVTSGGVFLGRALDDDYARFRVPDTSCPPLPEPAEPKDSGVADEAEPARWQWSGVYRSGVGWKFGSVQDGALNWIQPAYTCYDGDFVVELELSWDDTGLARQNNVVSSDFDLFIFGLPAVGCGIALGDNGSSSFYQPWVMAVVTIVNGVVGQQLGYMTAGQTYTFRISRTNGNISVSLVGQGSAQVATNVTGQVQLRLWRDYTLPPPPSQHIPAVYTYRITTISGAPSSVTVSTPTVDFGSPVEVQISWSPAVGTLEWRASNTAFSRDDATPAWNNPTGEYRYWQARVTWTQPNYLLERIEIHAPYLILEFVMLRNRFIWQAHTNQNPVVVPFRPIAASHRIGYIQQVTGGYEVSFSEQVDEYWLILQE